MSDYNGWENWHTWSANLWLNNDESTYKECRKICAILDENRAENALKSIAKEIIPVDEGIDYENVNWEEIYNAFNEE